MEWGLLTLVIVVLIVVLGREIRQVRGQAERAAIQTTLGVLRTALVVAHLEAAVGTGRAGGQAVVLAPDAGRWWADEDRGWNVAPEANAGGSVLLHVLLEPA